MKTIYETQIRTICPADKELDFYHARFESTRTILVEDIVKAIAAWENKKAYQEDITANLSRSLGCSVMTIGWHSGVKTTVTVP